MDRTLSRSIDVFSAYIVMNQIPAAEIRSVIQQIYDALLDLENESDGDLASRAHITKREVNASVRYDSLISFIDGQAYKTLKRHLTAHGFTPEQYRAEYGLPANYPMVAPGYAAKRAEIARALQLNPNRSGREQ